MPVTLEAGDAAPAFSLPDQDGVTHRLADYGGRMVVLYFYPKDETPGCTKQACSLRDHELAIQARGAVVLGVSTDSAESHRKFRAAHSLGFPLLVDDGAQVATACWGSAPASGVTRCRSPLPCCSGCDSKSPRYREQARQRSSPRSEKTFICCPFRPSAYR